MENYDDNLPQRKIDNVQFVDSSKFLNYNDPGVGTNQKQETGFAVAALQELPDHFQACKSMGLL